MKKYLLFILVICTCNLTGKENTGQSNELTKLPSTNKVYKTISYKLSDPINYKDFQVTFNWNNDEKYSTVDSTFRRNYSDGERCVKFTLTKEEKALIYKTAKEINFFNLPKELEMRHDISISPSFSTKIIIQIGKKTHSVYNMSDFILDSTIEKRFKKITSVIRGIIYEKKEIKKLPKSDRVYL